MRHRHEGEIQQLHDELGIRTDEALQVKTGRDELVTKHEAEVEEFTSKISDKNSTVESLEQAINIEKASNQELERQLFQLRENCVALGSELDAAKVPSKSNEAEINSLKIRMGQLNELANTHIQRGATIVKRYELGDLVSR